jgi:putative endonuclease
VVAVEVKTRAGNGYGSGFEAITHTKARRLRRLFLLWLRTFSPNCARLRIDAIAICLQAEGRPRIEHLRGIV